MSREEAKRILGADATEDQINALIASVTGQIELAVATETKGLVENKTKLLGQMDKLKNNQLPEDFDLEGYNKLLSEKETLDKKAQELADQELEGKGQWEALKIQLNETHTTAFSTMESEKNTEIAGLKTALSDHLIENSAMKAIGAEKGNSLFLMPHMKSQLATVQDENGKWGVHVIGEDGKQRMSEDQSKPFEVTDLVAQFKANEAFAGAFPNLDGGAGDPTPPGGKGGTGANPWKSETKNVTEQARINKDNPALAAQYKKAAGIAA